MRRAASHDGRPGRVTTWRTVRPSRSGPKLVCTLFLGSEEVVGTLHDTQGGPVLAPFQGERVYRATDSTGAWYLKLDHPPERPEHAALVERARSAGWAVVV